MEPVHVTLAARLVALATVGLMLNVAAGAALLRTLRAALRALTDTSYHRPGVWGGRAVTPD